MTSDSASRVTRSRRDLRVALVLFFAALAVVTALRAQEPPKASTATPPTEQPAPSAASPPADSPAPPASPAPDRKPGTSPGRFEPTEKVRADFDVSFPVDI